MSVSIASGGGLSYPDSVILQLDKTKPITVNVDSTTPIVLAKWKIVFNALYKIHDLFALVEWYTMYFHDTLNSGDSIFVKYEYSWDDVTYHNIFSDQWNDNFNDGSINVSTDTSSPNAFINNPTSNNLYIRFTTYCTNNTDVFSLDELHMMMILGAVLHATIIRLV